MGHVLRATIIQSGVTPEVDFGYNYGQLGCIALDTDSNIYVGNFLNSRILKFDPDGVLLSVFHSSSIPVWGSISVAVDTTYNVYVADSHGGLQKFAPNGTLLTNCNITSLFPYFEDPQIRSFRPQGLAIDSSNNLYLSDSYNNRVFKLDSQGEVLAILATSNPSLRVPTVVTLDANDNIYVVDTGNTRVVKFGTTGSVLKTFETSNPPLSDPTGMAVDLDNNLYVVDTWNNNRIVVWGSNSD